MFSSPREAGILAMRPGMLSGHYPEREDRPVGWFERAFDVLRRGATLWIPDREAGLGRVAMEIGRLGDGLTGLGNEELSERLVGLRRKVYNQGLREELCLEAFTLIREISGRTIGQRHYDSQLMAGWVLLHGRLAEMETGEGKTLAATLAAATAALAGIPVHVLTVNEYLVQRDAAAMGPLYRALGLSVGFVTEAMPPEERREAYACDVTYATNKQVAFDYLRDRLLLGNERSRLRLKLESAYTDHHRMGQSLLRGLCFAIVDEADSVLIDEARTPLILTRNVNSSAEHAAYREAMKLAQGLENGPDFRIDPARSRIQLTLTGGQKLAHWKSAATGLPQNTRHAEELLSQALHALHLLHRDRDYLVRDDTVHIVDANTGRTMPDRSWERGLHQLVEAKEGCSLTEAREQLGRLTYQHFFRRYLRLAGLTGTAREVGRELWSTYSLEIHRVPLNRPSRRRRMGTRIFISMDEKWTAITAAVKDLQTNGQPVLIGTGSVAESELLSERLTFAGVLHRVLNARQDEAEAEIVAAAGQKGQVTVATNMAGRGTDIPLADGVAALGGLHVIASCPNEARRIDRQLLGRCARQGDPGSCQALLSLEDELLQQNSHPSLLRVLQVYTKANGMLHERLNLFCIRRAQLRVEGRHRRARRNLLRQQRRTGRMLAFSGNME